LKVKSQLPTRLEVLEAISDEKSLYLFDYFGKNEYADESCDHAMKIMTRKQYYTRLTKLSDANLIKRANGSYVLTHFGMLIYEAHLIMGGALKNRWKLMAFDNLYNLNSSDPVIISRCSEIMALIINRYSLA
jgi:hypothetical protein